MKDSQKNATKPRQPATWATQHDQLGFPPPLDANGNPKYNDTTIIAKVAALPSLDACPSSNPLGQLSVVHNGGSGPVDG